MRPNSRYFKSLKKTVFYSTLAVFQYFVFLQRSLVLHLFFHSLYIIFCHKWVLSGDCTCVPSSSFYAPPPHPPLAHTQVVAGLPGVRAKQQCRGNNKSHIVSTKAQYRPNTKIRKHVNQLFTWKLQAVATYSGNKNIMVTYSLHQINNIINKNKQKGSKNSSNWITSHQLQWLCNYVLFWICLKFAGSIFQAEEPL